MSGLIFDYTFGYPFLVSRLCQLLARNYETESAEAVRKKVWTNEGFNTVVRLILAEKTRFLNH